MKVNKKRVFSTVVIILTTIFILLLVFLFINVEQIPCEIKCRYQYPLAPPRADGSLFPGIDGDYMFCVDKCTGKIGTTLCPYKYNGPSGPYCGKNRMEIFLRMIEDSRSK